MEKSILDEELVYCTQIENIPEKEATHILANSLKTCNLSANPGG